jgi:hypothetical protein
MGRLDSLYRRAADQVERLETGREQVFRLSSVDMVGQHFSTSRGLRAYQGWSQKALLRFRIP